MSTTPNTNWVCQNCGYINRLVGAFCFSCGKHETYVAARGDVTHRRDDGTVVRIQWGEGSPAGRTGFSMTITTHNFRTTP